MTTAEWFFDMKSQHYFGGGPTRERQRDPLIAYQKVRGGLVTNAYPKAPPSWPVAVVVPREIGADVYAEPTEVHQAQIEEVLPPLHAFKAVPETVELFVHSYNGTGLDWLSLWLMRALVDTQSASDLLSEAVEGALIATFQHLRSRGQDKIVIQQVDEIVLKGAIKRRLPRVALELRESLASSLLAQIKESLSYGRTLLIDGASVSVDRGCLVAQVFKAHHDRTTDETGKQELLAA